MGGYPHTQPFFTNFSNSKNFYKCFDLSGGTKFFFAKVPQKWSSSSKKLLRLFRYIRGGVKPDVTFVTFWEKKIQMKNGGYPHAQPFFTNFSNSKNFYKCFDLSGGQKFFPLRCNVTKNTMYFIKETRTLLGHFCKKNCPQKGQNNCKNFQNC